MIISIGNAPGVEGDVQPGYAGIGRREMRVVSRPGYVVEFHCHKFDRQEIPDGDTWHRLETFLTCW